MTFKGSNHRQDTNRARRVAGVFGDPTRIAVATRTIPIACGCIATYARKGDLWELAKVERCKSRCSGKVPPNALTFG